jgi:quaternary ammonium compound-resistance protein SugE
MAWAWLIAAGLLEVVWAYFMKQSEGFTRPAASLATLGAMGASFALLALAMRTLPLSVAYPAWTGIGALGAFLVGVVVLGEDATPLKLCAAALIAGGLVLMKLSGSS